MIVAPRSPMSAPRRCHPVTPAHSIPSSPPTCRCMRQQTTGSRSRSSTSFYAQFEFERLDVSGSILGVWSQRSVTLENSRPTMVYDLHRVMEPAKRQRVPRRVPTWPRERSPCPPAASNVPHTRIMPRARALMPELEEPFALRSQAAHAVEAGTVIQHHRPGYAVPHRER